MSLLASIGLIVSSPVIGESVIVPDAGSDPFSEVCQKRIETLMSRTDSSIVDGAEDSVVKNLAPSDCTRGRIIYETNLVHRLPSEARIQRVEIVPLPDQSVPENE